MPDVIKSDNISNTFQVYKRHEQKKDHVHLPNYYYWKSIDSFYGIQIFKASAFHFFSSNKAVLTFSSIYYEKRRKKKVSLLISNS